MLLALAAVYFAYVIGQFGPQDSIVQVHYDFNIRDYPYIKVAFLFILNSLMFGCVCILSKQKLSTIIKQYVFSKSCYVWISLVFTYVRT